MFPCCVHSGNQKRASVEIKFILGGSVKLIFPFFLSNNPIFLGCKTFTDTQKKAPPRIQPITDQFYPSLKVFRKLDRRRNKRDFVLRTIPVALLGYFLLLVESSNVFFLRKTSFNSTFRIRFCLALPAPKYGVISTL